MGDGQETITITVAIRGICDRATPEDVETVWNWLQQALSLYGVGSRTASGYGSLKPATKISTQLEPGYSKKTFDFTLYTQGCAGANTGTMELRPSHWRGWLRSWVLRFLLGVMSKDDAQKTVGELFGTIEPEAVQGCVRLRMIQSRTWGEKSEDSPTFYTWKGKLEISAPRDILNKIILPIVKFAVTVGGVGRGWRRPLHIFTMNNGKAAARGTHLRLTYKNPQTDRNVLYGISPARPEQWQQTYQNWLEAVKNKWQNRINLNANRQLAAEVLSPHTCAIYVVPAPVEEPIDTKELTWAFTDAVDTRGDGMELIYQEQAPKNYKRNRDLGGSAAGGGNSHCSWVSIKRVNVPNQEENTDCQEIVCLFMGGQTPQSNHVRSRFLADLNKITGAVHLFGVHQ